jgi:hypothetical protein
VTPRRAAPRRAAPRRAPPPPFLPPPRARPPGFRISETVTAPAPAGGAGGAAGLDDDERQSWKRAVVEKIVLKLYEYRQELGSSFKLFDENGDGVISREEFHRGLRSLTYMIGQPITEMQADELLKHLDVNGDGSIDYQEFINAFRVVDTHSASAIPTTHALITSPRRGRAATGEFAVRSTKSAR